MGYKWVTKSRGFAVNQALFDALLPNTFSKQPAKKPQGPVTLLKSTHLVLRIRSADRRWAFADLGPWAMFLGNGFWLRDMNSKKIFIFKKGGCPSINPFNSSLLFAVGNR